MIDRFDLADKMFNEVNLDNSVFLVNGVITTPPQTPGLLRERVKSCGNGALFIQGLVKRQ